VSGTHAVLSYSKADRERAAARARYAKNPGPIIARSIAWRRTESPEQKARRNAGQRARYAKDPQKFMTQTKAYRKANYLRYLSLRRKRNGLPEATRPEPEVCECCGNGCPRGGHLSVDHDHVTGAFRGWLCRRCNLGLGSFGDSVAGVEAALQYLRRFYGG
jgi:Recombination endonuclease VII